MTEAAQTLGEDLEALASDLVASVHNEGTPIGTKLEVFKIVTQYYVGSRRLGKKVDSSDDPEIPSLASMRAAVDGLE